MTSGLERPRPERVLQRGATRVRPPVLPRRGSTLRRPPISRAAERAITAIDRGLAGDLARVERRRDLDRARITRHLNEARADTARAKRIGDEGVDRAAKWARRISEAVDTARDALDATVPASPGRYEYLAQMATQAERDLQAAHQESLDGVNLATARYERLLAGQRDRLLQIDRRAREDRAVLEDEASRARAALLG